MSKFRVEISANVLLRDIFVFVFTAMAMKISSHLVFRKCTHISDDSATSAIRTAELIYEAVLRRIPEDSSLHGLVNTHTASSSSA
jgi:hypothetical protein